MSKVTKNCQRCKKEMQVRQADVNRGWGRFCSKSCKAKQQVASGGHGKSEIGIYCDMGHPMASGCLGHGQN